MQDEEPPDFHAWLRSEMPNWTWDWPHQLLIYAHLERVTRGETKRLMIFMPPRHSKSETVTVRYTTWRMIREPQMHVILGSYNQRLANRFSRKIRRIAEAAMPLAKDRKAVDEWETTAGGGLCAVGVGSGVTGYGAQLIVIDDPVKNRSEAESRAYRESTWDWFNDDIYTRLEPRAAMILIQTRWHEDDLAGRLLKEMADGGEEWEILSLSALAEEDNDRLGRNKGEALCPERYDRDTLLNIKRKLGSYAFSALYQQRPVPRDGGLFKRKWFGRIVDAAPKGLRWCRAYDLAVSTKTTADFTASFRCALDANGDLYIADGFRGRLAYPEQYRYVTERMAAEEWTSHGIEEALHGLALLQDLKRERSLSRYPLKGIKADTDKVTRALAWASRAEAGQVVLVRGAWIDEFLEEVCRFPDGRHDDQVDAVSLAVRMLSEQGKIGAKGF
ncbi:MAG: phage terminase large subunit [Acidobacteria bacterium]|nr:phage terminase large subunit [Acidobacteriota bacterium]